MLGRGLCLGEEGRNELRGEKGIRVVGLFNWGVVSGASLGVGAFTTIWWMR